MFSLTRRTRAPARNHTAESSPSAPTPQADEALARIALSEEGIIMYASAAFCDLAGCAGEMIAQSEAASIMQFPDAPATFRHMPGGPQTIRFARNKTTAVFHFDWLATPDGRRYLVGSQQEAAAAAIRAVFEPKILQARASQSAHAIQNPDELAQFMEMSRDAMIVVGDLGEIVRVNTGFRRIFGYGDRDLENLDLIDLFHPEDKPYVRNTVQTLNLEDGVAQTLDFEARIITKTGEARWMEWRQMQNGPMTFCIGHDVTAIKQHSKALARREKQLLEAESIGRMGHWNWVLGQDSFEWSDEIYRIFGVTKDSFVPTLDSMNKKIHKNDINRVNHALQRAMIEQHDYEMEFRIQRPDNEERYIRCEGRCSTDNRGEVRALYGIMQDITQQMRHEQELRAAKDAAERAYAARTQFLANMSHELRTPLNAIIGFSEMMHRQLLGPIGTPKYLEYIQGIRESGEHLLDIISDILDMSKIEAGKYELSLEEVNLHKIIRLAMHMMEGRALDAQVSINLSPGDSETITLVADRRAFLQVMLNVLSNAVKFSHKGGAVTIQTTLKKSAVIITVSDQGIGIPPNKLASITNPFEQVSSSYTRNHEGTGLGLAITKELVEMHGGTLGIESTLDVGTTVTIKWPLQAAQ